MTKTRIENLEQVVGELLERMEIVEVVIFPHCEQCDGHHPQNLDDLDLLEEEVKRIGQNAVN